MSVDGFIKGYKDVPSLAQISKHVNGKGSSGDADKDKENKPDSKTEAIKEEEAPKETAPVAPASEKPNETPSIVEPKVEERTTSETGEHPLEHTWCVPILGF